MTFMPHLHGPSLHSIIQYVTVLFEELAAVKEKCVDLEGSSERQISELQENITKTQSR